MENFGFDIERLLVTKCWVATLPSRIDSALVTSNVGLFS